jgi:AcrR family transcriptional regulator
MQRPDPTKRAQILATAARLFATKPFHEVKLDDIAAKARIGKGTLYVYFSSKEDLYISLVHEALCRLVDDVRANLAAAAQGTETRLAIVIGKLVDFAYAFPDLFELLRAGLHFSDKKLLEKRAELAHVVEEVLRAGVRRREIDDAHPELTAQYVLAFLRVAMLHRPEGTTARKLKDHMLRVLSRGLFSGRTVKTRKQARR